MASDQAARDGLAEGFERAFTWSNIGQQIGSGLISGGAGFVVGSLLESLFSDGENMQDMMQNFADQIVSRLTVEFRNILDDALFADRLQRLKVSTSSLGEKYAIFQATGDMPLLDASVNHAFDAVESAVAMGAPAIGTFVVAAGLKMCLFEEKARFNEFFHVQTRREVERAAGLVERWVAELLEADRRAVGQWRSCKTIPNEGRFCFITVNGRVIHTQVFNAEEDRQVYIDALIRQTMTEIVIPAREIVATWRRFT